MEAISLYLCLMNLILHFLPCEFTFTTTIHCHSHLQPFPLDRVGHGLLGPAELNETDRKDEQGHTETHKPLPDLDLPLAHHGKPEALDDGHDGPPRTIIRRCNGAAGGGVNG